MQVRAAIGVMSQFLVQKNTYRSRAVPLRSRLRLRRRLAHGIWRRLVRAWPLAIIVVGFGASVVWTGAFLWLAYHLLSWALN